MDDRHYQLVKAKYDSRGKDHSDLFETILAVAQETSMETALEGLERCAIETRTSWLDENLPHLERTADPIDDAYRIFYEAYLGISAPGDGEIIERTPTRLVTRWWNQCPTLDVCQQLGLDTREICNKGYHKSVQVFLSRIHPGLRFDRNYDALRPHGPYCEETITLDE
jgi:hypothetical protein